MTREGGPGSGPQGDNSQKASGATPLAHFTYGPEYKSGVKYEKPSTYPKAPGRLNKTECENEEKLLPFSSGPAHISTYPLSQAGILLAAKKNKESDMSPPLMSHECMTKGGVLSSASKKESDSGSSFPQCLRGQDEKL